MMQPKGATARGGAVERSETEGEHLAALARSELFPFRPLTPFVSTFPVNGDSFGGVVSGLLLFIATPQSRLRLASSPINGGAFWCGINSYIKPALKGEVGFA